MTVNQDQLNFLNNYVMSYESMQKERIAFMNRARSFLRDSIHPDSREGKKFTDKEILNHPDLPMDFMNSARAMAEIEDDMEKLIKSEIKKHPICQWLINISGIGPIYAARLYHKTWHKNFPQVSNLWSYAGLDGPGWRHRPHNWDLTSICYLIGENFIMNGDKYREVYDERKEYERTKEACNKCIEKREELEETAEGTGKTAQKAKARLRKWKENRCSPGHINNKTRRYAVKEFLKDYWVKMQEVKEIDVKNSAASS